ncbi:MAG: hypothetical protein F4X44_10415 [Gammaproteobacteria bacterium]|nr:hypothetical protein [Gammaproteobacteria bacterium]MYD81011.1 hypothetical protein [Gammaproteobacteria bacterium]
MIKLLSTLNSKKRAKLSTTSIWFKLLIVLGVLAGVYVNAQDANAPPAPSVQLAVVESSTSVFLRWTVDTNTSVSDQVVTETRITWQAQGSDESSSTDVEVNSTNCDSTTSYPITCETTVQGLAANTSYALTLAAHGVVYEAGSTTIETDYGFGDASAATNRQTHADFELDDDLLAGSEKQQRMPFVRLVSNNSATGTLSSVALFTFLTERGIDSSASNPHLWSYSASVSPRNSVRTVIVIDFDSLVEDDLFRLIGTYRDSVETDARVTVTATFKEDSSVQMKRDIVFTVIRNRAPVFGVTAVTYEMSEDNPSNIHVAGNFQLTDAENHSITYSLETVEPDDAVFEIDEQTGLISVIQGEELDYETATQHILHVTAIDSVGDSSNNLVITIDVLDVDEGPTVGEQEFEEMEVTAHQNMGFDEDWVNFHVRNWFVDEEDDPLCYNAEIIEGSEYATVRVSTSGGSDCGLPHVQVRRKDIVGLRTVQEVELEITATEDTDDDPGSASAKATVSIVYGTNIEPNIWGGRLVNASPNSAYLDNYDAGSDTSFDMVFTALDVVPSNDRLCFTLAGRDRLHFKLVYPDRPSLTASCKLEGSNSSDGTINNSHQIRVKSVRPLERGRSDSTYRFDLVATDLSGFADTLAFELTTDNVWSGLISHPMPDAHFLLGDPSETIQLDEYFDHTEDRQADHLTYEVRSGNYYVLEVSEYDGELTLTPADSLQTDRETTFVTVIAEDEDGYTVRETFDVHVKRYNSAPRFERVTTTYTLDEDFSVGKYFTRTPDAYDPDNEEIYFRLAEEDRPFAADTTTGHITIYENLDFESQSEYEVTLYVEDQFGGYDSEKITITVNDVNEAPVPSTEEIADVEILVGLGLPEDLLGSDHFTDPDIDDVLSFEATSSRTSTATAEIDEDGYVVVEGIKEGESTISVEASDTGDPPLRAAKSFLVTVHENLAPTLIEQLADMDVNVGGEKKLDLDSVFEDEPEDIHTYTAKSADSSVASVDVTDSDLTVSGESEGSVRISVTVTDAAENVATARFSVNVSNNEPPILAQEIEDIDSRVGRVIDILLSSHFEDEGDELEFEATLDDEEVAEASIQDNETLKISALAEGETTCTVTATDTLGESISDEFEISVLEANDPPIVTRQLDDIELSLVSHTRYDVDIEGLFDDEKPDELEIEVEPSTEEYADVVLRENNTVIRIYPLKRGDFIITVTAEDDIEQTASTDFHVAILSEEINTAPQVDEPIADQTIYVDDDFEADLEDVFSDAERDDLTFTAESDDSDIATVDISDSNVLTVHGESAGTATITAEATDPDGESATDTFRVTVKTAPIANQSVATVTLQHGGESLSFNMYDSFSDADGDPLAFHTIDGNESEIAEVALVRETLHLAPIQRGKTSVVVIATDPDGNSARKQFNVVVSDEELMTVARNALSAYGRSLLTSATTAIGDRATHIRNESDLTLSSVWSHFAFRRANRSLDDAPFNDSSSLSHLNFGSNSSAAFPPGHLYRSFNPEIADNIDQSGSRDSFTSTFSFWSKTDSSSFAGDGYVGQAETSYLGTDIHALRNGIVGLALMSSTSQSAYSWGRVEENLKTSLRSVIPYFKKELNSAYSVWAGLGYGRGESRILSGSELVSTSPLTMNLGALGLRRVLSNKDSYSLAVRTDFSGITLNSKETEFTSGLRASARQFRLAIDGSVTKQIAHVLRVQPFGQIGLRYDHGDDIRGEGLEVAGGLRLTTPLIQIEARGSRFQLNDHTDIQESGWSVSATYDLSNDELGWHLELRPSYGCDSQSGEFDWMRTAPIESSSDFGYSCSNRRSLQAKVGYGSYVFNDRIKFVPHLRFESDKLGNTRRSMEVQAELGLLSGGSGAIGFLISDGNRQRGDSTQEFQVTGSIRF